MPCHPKTVTPRRATQVEKSFLPKAFLPKGFEVIKTLSWDELLAGGFETGRRAGGLKNASLLPQQVLVRPPSNVTFEYYDYDVLHTTSINYKAKP